ncbi:hypothetical protein [Pseudomonas sp. Z18(2022)]|nr:hypothetical protein [Pseudomonas sp. Z18(2022)]
MKGVEIPIWNKDMEAPAQENHAIDLTDVCYCLAVVHPHGKRFVE